MKKYVFYIALFLTIFGFSSHVYADEIVIDMPIAEPAINDNSGYVIVLTQNVNTGNYFARLHYVNTFVNEQKNSFAPFTTATIDSYQVSLIMNVGVDNVGLSNIYYQWSGTNQYGHVTYSYTTSKNWTWSNNEYRIISYQYKGNINIINNIGGTKVPFTIKWADQQSEYAMINDILTYIIAIYGDQVDLYNLNLEVFNNTKDIKDILTNLYDYIETYIPELYDYVKNIDNTAFNIFTQIRDIYYLLRQQFESYKGESSTTPPSNDKINDYNDAENQVIDKNKDPNDIAADINISLNSNTNDYIWNLVTEILNTNTKIFTFVISMLSIGAIALVLGRG